MATRLRTRRKLLERGTLVLAIAILTATASPAQDLKLGKKTFKRHCEECHGKDGRGKGEKALRSGFKPRDLSLGSFKCRCTASGEMPTDEDLLRSVVDGLPGASMPAHPELSSEEAASAVAYLKTFSERFLEPRAACIAVPQPMPSTPTLIEEGALLYRYLSCGACHGVAGRGDGPSAETLTDDWGEPIKVHDFVRMKKFKCGGSPEGLYRTLHTGLNGTPMPSYSEAFLFAPSAGHSDPAAVGNATDADLERYLASQPDQATLDTLPAAERSALVEHRTWALVHFIRSLIPPE